MKQYHGIEISKLKPGDVISEEELHSIYEKNVPLEADHTRKTPFFAFVLEFRYRVEKTLFELGKFARVVQRDGGITLIQNDDMSVYTQKQIEKAIRKVMRETAMFRLTNTDKMTPEQLVKHKRNMCDAEEQVGAIFTTRNRLGLITGSTKVYGQLRSDKKIDWNN